MTHTNFTPDPPASSSTASGPAPCPPHIPEKFWDATTGTVRVDDMAKSYRELEKRFMTRKLGSPLESGDKDGDKITPTDPCAGTPDLDPDVISVQSARDAMFKQLGRPDSPDDYVLSIDHPYLTLDPDLNARLHALGFTENQVQFVYDIAVERMVPLILDLVADQRAEYDLEKMITAFGGKTKWQETARQVQAFARKNLPPSLVEHLSQSFDGIMMIYHMMQANTEGGIIPIGIGTSAQTTLPGLDRIRNMMRDPRYWRDHDPKFVEKVSAGFDQIYG